MRVTFDASHSYLIFPKGISTVENVTIDLVRFSATTDFCDLVAKYTIKCLGAKIVAHFGETELKESAILSDLNMTCNIFLHQKRENLSHGMKKDPSSFLETRRIDVELDLTQITVSMGLDRFSFVVGLWRNYSGLLEGKPVLRLFIFLTVIKS